VGVAQLDLEVGRNMMVDGNQNCGHDLTWRLRHVAYVGQSLSPVLLRSPIIHSQNILEEQASAVPVEAKGFEFIVGIIIDTIRGMPI
jgi:hypothetical protein